MTVLAWSDLEEFAAEVFDIFTEHPEIAWARTSWQILIEKDLTTCFGPIDRTLVMCRFFAMGALFHGFWNFGAGEGSVDLSDWANSAGLSTFRVGETAGKFRDESFAYEDDDDMWVEEDDAYLFEEGLQELVEREYPKVVDALRDGYGNTSKLFVSLWLSSDKTYAGLRNWPREVFDDVVNHDLSDKGPAFMWLDQGAGLNDWNWR